MDPRKAELQDELRRLEEIEMRGHLTQTGQNSIDRVRAELAEIYAAKQNYVGRPRRAGKERDKIIDRLLLDATYDASTDSYTLADGQLLTKEGINQADLVTLRRYLEEVELAKNPRPVRPTDGDFAYVFAGSTVRWDPRTQRYINRLGDTRTNREVADSNRVMNMNFMLDPGDICYLGNHLASDVDNIPEGTVVVWMAKRRFTYAAIKANENWYITGAGVFYGGNNFNHDQFRNGILAHSETSDARFAFNGRAIDCGPPF